MDRVTRLICVECGAVVEPTEPDSRGHKQLACNCTELQQMFDSAASLLGNMTAGTRIASQPPEWQLRKVRV